MTNLNFKNRYVFTIKAKLVFMLILAICALIFLGYNSYTKMNWLGKIKDEMDNSFQKMVEAKRVSHRGDEFIILKPGIKGPAEVSEFVNKLLDVFKRSWKLDKHEFYLTASVGITIYPADGTDAGLLLKNADMAMYRAKETGKNKFCFFDQQMNESVQQKMKKGLHDAIKKCFVN